MNIELKKWEATDVAALAALCDGVDRRYLSNRFPSPYTRADAERWLQMVEEREGRGGLFRAIMLDGSLAGMISAEQKKDIYCVDAEVGALLATKYWSCGIMTEAVRQLCLLAFREMDIVRITGLAYEENLASRRVMEKNGFIMEGLMRNALIKNGKIHNLCVYGKLKE